MVGRNAYKKPNPKDTQEGTQPNIQADIRTALRTVVVHGHANRLSRPDDEDLIWHGDWRWHHSDEHEPSYEEFDWLVDYLADNTVCSPAEGGDARTDDATKGDALLALSAMRGLGSHTKRKSYISSLIRCMGSTRPPRVRHSMLRAVFEAREELASITSVSTPEDLDVQLLEQLSRALLTAVHPNGDQTVLDSKPAPPFHRDREFYYLILIYTLIKNDEWCRRLIRTNDDHLARWISLVDRDHVEHDPLKFLLLMIFWHIKSSGKDIGISPADERWQLLITDAWRDAQSIEWDDYVDGIPAFVTATKLDWTASDNREWLVDLAPMVHATLVRLQEPERQATLRDGGVAQDTIDAALFSMQGLKDDLCRITKDETPRKEMSVELRDIEGKY
ncbi:hypothetical protein BDR04DRAFT_1090061 [Suillus decipiens]|nr:hypothetical protein BDR04DRAFT_1090061 [Suillus decipiens]